MLYKCEGSTITKSCFPDSISRFNTCVHSIKRGRFYNLTDLKVSTEIIHFSMKKYILLSKIEKKNIGQGNLKMCLKEKIKGKRQGEGRGREKSQSNMEARTEDTACSPLIHQSP